MCLYTKDKKAKVATKDIVCYKVIKIYNTANVWTGIYYGRDCFPFNEKVEALGEKDICILEVVKELKIGRGFFHAYLNLEDAKYLLHEEENWILHDEENWTPNCKLVKCIIPKGSEYYVSREDGEICASSIIVYKDVYPHNKSSRYTNVIVYFKTLLNKIFKL